jgi:hypothetical protein
MNKQVIKAEMNIIVMRNVVENYQTLARSFEKHKDDELPEYGIDTCIGRYRSAWASNIRGGLEILGQNEITSDTLDKIKKNVGEYVDFNSVENVEVISDFDMLEIQRVAENIIRKPYQDWMYKEKTKIRYNFAEDAKRTRNRIKQPAGQAMKISPDIFAEHYSQNWEIEPARIDIDDNSDFIMQRKLVLTENDMLKELLNKKKMIEAISKKGNLSAPGLDKLTYPILKYEKDDAAELLIAIMTMMLRTQKCPTAWKEGKVVMLPKPCNENEKDQPNNWRPITLTNIMYRIIFGRIADYFQSIHKLKGKDGDGIVCRQQKGFIKNINGCCEYGARINFLIRHAMEHGNQLFVAALDCKDAFGSVSHQLLDINLKALGIPTRLRNLIMDSYKDSQVRIWSNGSASRPIDIKKGVKQGCPLSPLLFNICVDPLLSFIRKFDEADYSTSELGSTTIQAYADDMLLVANSAEKLQILINRAKSFFDFANIKLNPAKCEVFRVNERSKDQNIIIEGVEKQYVTDSFVKYLGIPLGSRKLCKTKFLESKIQKVLEELDKAEFSRLAINQIVRVIKCYILNKLYFLFANMYIPKGTLSIVDKKVRKVINNFVKGQKLQRSYLYASVKNGGLGLPCMEDEYASYKIHHITNLMATTDGKGILDDI